jgi:uncharacterized repeat protein (TIGR01451 family)
MGNGARVSLSARLKVTFLFTSTFTCAIGALGCRATSDADSNLPDLVRSAVFTNGDFESDAIGANPTGWTISAFINPEITDRRPLPQTLNSLNLAAGGYLATHVVGGAAESQVDPDLGARASLRFPKYGTRAAVVNYQGAANPGNNQNVNQLTQTMTTTNGDVDPADNKVHIRFALAPVLYSGGHDYIDQPYYYVQLDNVTKGTQLFQDFNASAQAGVPWKTDGANSFMYYTDWSLVDIAPGNAGLAVGDQVRLIVISGGCAFGGHFGRVYLDGIGSTIPGIYTAATGPASANAGSDITYVVSYKNGGTATAISTQLKIVIPTGTTYRSNNLGSSCAGLSAGATGTLTCSLGDLAAGASGSFTVSVNINAGTAVGSNVTNGDYSIGASGINALLGPKVLTAVTSGVSYADVSVTKTDGVAAVGWGQAVTYAVVVSNAGPSAATGVTLTDTVPAQLTGVTWTCTSIGGATCAASGTGSLNTSLTLPVGGRTTYSIQGNVVAGGGTGSVVNTVTATVGGGTTDPDGTNNTAVDTDSIGVLRTVSLTKTNGNGGSVTSVPASILCDTSCTSASGAFVDGVQVVLTAAPVSGAAFAGWGGACAAAGSTPTCTLTISADVSVTAAFTPPPTVNVLAGSNQGTATGTPFATPLSVRVLDSAGSPIAGATVIFSVPSAGASAALSSGSATTNSSGDAAVTAIANGTSGAYSIVAGLSGTPISTTFSLWNFGIAASIAVVSGSGQSSPAGTAFLPLVVVVRDATSQLVVGATVTFGAPAGGPSATLGTAITTTNASGQASTSAAPNGIPGTFSVTAGTNGAAASAIFSLTNNVGPPAQVVVVSGGTQSATVSTAFGLPLVVRVTDAFGSLLSGVTVSFAAPSSAATATLSPAAATTNASGQASVSATANAIVGPYTVAASVAGTITSASFMLTNQAVLVISPDSTTTAPNGAVQFTASGGSGTGYAFAFMTNTSGATLDAATGGYRAGARPNSTDVVVVTDNAGHSASATVTVGGGVDLAPPSSTIPPRGVVAFTVSGGAATTYSFTLTTNLSGGSIDAAGGYRAGATGNVTDVVTATDAFGNTAAAVVHVGAPLTLIGGGASSPPRGALTFSTSGGNGNTGTTYLLSANGSGGSIDSSTGVYTAGATPSITDVVTATDTLGNVATAAIQVGPGVSVTPSTPTPAPRESIHFVAGGGSTEGFVFTIAANGSGAIVDATTGVYVAGPTGGTVDVVKVMDSFGNFTNVSVSVGDGLSVNPPVPTVAPGQTQAFTAHGGSGSGYRFELATNGSGAAIAAVTGVYTAGFAGNTTDSIRVTDSLGNHGTASVTVGPGLTLSPATVTLAPTGTRTFSVSGGSGEGITFTLDTNTSAGSIDPSTGIYQAGANGRGTDVVRATDSLGNFATAQITVTASLTAAPGFYVLAPRAQTTIRVSGGAASHTFAIVGNGSGGVVNPVTGDYTAGSIGGVVDLIRVRDSNGVETYVTVIIGANVEVTPASAGVAPRDSLVFTAAGGSGSGYAFLLTANASGASLDPQTGKYTAGPTTDVVDEITVTDSLGNIAKVRIVVGNGLVVVPGGPSIAPRAAITFSVSGGSGTGFGFDLTVNHSGGSIDAETGLYRAGSTADVVDRVRVTDSLGNQTEVAITVGDGISIAPSAAALPPLGGLQFTTRGGSGNGVRYALSTNGSGGGIDPDTGVYTAGTTPSVIDRISVTDDLGNSASASVTVGTGLILDPPVATVAPNGTIAFRASGGGGGYTFVIRANGSGATIASTSGVYVAGDRPDTKDVVEVTDGLGSVANAPVTIGGGLSLTPSTPQTEVGAVVLFTATGGGGAGYRFSLTTNGSGGSIDPSTGRYSAGTTNDTVDSVTVTDSLGNTAVVNISVGQGLALNPAAPSVAPGEGRTFTAVGGSGSGYAFTVASNASGGAIDASSGAYRAGAKARVTDVVMVTDGAGRTATASVKVGPGLTIAPAASTIAPASKIRFLVAGGSGNGNQYALAPNASRGSVDVDSGNYQAGTVGRVIDMVTVTDGLARQATATVTIGPALAVLPLTGTVPPLGSLQMDVSGGAGDYTFTLAQASSGGTVNHTDGLYQAGKTPSVTDVVAVHDANNVALQVTIVVGVGITIAPSTPSVPSLTALTLTATGGSGRGYSWKVIDNRSGGSVDAPGGTFTAGRVDTGSVIDVVQATDSLGNTAIVPIKVTRALRTGIGGGAGCDCTVPGARVRFGWLTVLALVAFAVLARRRRSAGR